MSAPQLSAAVACSALCDGGSRVWRAGHTQPPDVSVIRDRFGLVWQLDEDRDTWWPAAAHGDGQCWDVLAHDGPLVEVLLPHPVLE